MQVQVMVASSYPLVVEGVRCMLAGCEDIGVAAMAASCAEAAERLREAPVDIAILDVRFSDGCAFEVIENFDRAQPAPRFLLISSFDTDEHFSRAMDAGAHALLLRSVTRDELVAAVRAAAADMKYMPPRLATALFSPKEPSVTGECVLPSRQQQIIELMSLGQTNKEIARALSLSTETINTHVKQILRKLSARDRAHAVAIALRNSLIL